MILAAVIYAVTGLPWLGCLLAYGLRSPWWQKPTGRAMFTTYFALTLVLDMAVVLRLTHPSYAVALAVACFTLGVVFIAGLVQLLLILRAQRRPDPPSPRRQEP